MTKNEMLEKVRSMGLQVDEMRGGRRLAIPRHRMGDTEERRQMVEAELAALGWDVMPGAAWWDCPREEEPQPSIREVYEQASPEQRARMDRAWEALGGFVDR